MSRMNTNFNIRVFHVDSQLGFSPSVITSEAHPACDKAKKKDGHQRPQNQRDHTAFRPYASAAEPIRTNPDVRIEEVAGRAKTAVIHTEEKRLSPVPAGVSTHRKPETTSAPKRGRCEQGKNACCDDSNSGLAAIAHMSPGK